MLADTHLPTGPVTTKVSCTRRLQFCAGHRVMEHESKCRHLHGHNYVVHITAVPKVDLDSQGRVVDFSVLKEQYGGWIDKNWDHGFILQERDRAAYAAVSSFTELERSYSTVPFSQKIYLLPTNPTAENIAKYLLHAVPNYIQLPTVDIIKVVVDETENCSATAQKE